jgi:hypothetical protein
VAYRSNVESSIRRQFLRRNWIAPENFYNCKLYLGYPTPVK